MNLLNPCFSINRSDMQSIISTLVHSSVADVNSTVSERDLRTALHLACAMGNLAVVQILIWVSYFTFKKLWKT